jgi:hypothetical protein
MEPEGEDPGPMSHAAGGGASETPEDALRRLEERLNRASEAAERLLADAAESAASNIRDKPPPAGWAPPSEHTDSAPGTRTGDGDVELLIGLLRSLRDLIPPDLQRRLADALREVLLALRALIDWYLERAEKRRGQATEVQDIPIL